MRLVGGLLRPYRGGWLTIVLLALLVETAMSLAAPWPLKVILRSAGFSGGKVHRLLEEGSMNTTAEIQACHSPCSASLRGFHRVF